MQREAQKLPRRILWIIIGFFIGIITSRMTIVDREQRTLLDAKLGMKTIKAAIESYEKYYGRSFASIGISTDQGGRLNISEAQDVLFGRDRERNLQGIAFLASVNRKDHSSNLLDPWGQPFILKKCGGEVKIFAEYLGLIIKCPDDWSRPGLVDRDCVSM
jgi:hypothetical protein